MDAKWKCQPGKFYSPISVHARLYSMYGAPSGPASLIGTESALNTVPPSLTAQFRGQLRASLCQAPPGLGRPRSPPCETPRKVGRCSWKGAACRKVSPFQPRVWDAAYSNSRSSAPPANGNKNRGGAISRATQHTGGVISY